MNLSEELPAFAELGLGTSLLRAIKEQGYTEPTEIQSKAIPYLNQGRDLIGIAQTGGGKTAAFVLPLLEHLIVSKTRRKPKEPRAVILAPTRELAKQIADQVKLLSVHTPVKHQVIYGGASYGPQIQALHRGVDILIATPGRLKDHVEQGNVRFDQTEIFVLDEADRMLDMGFVGEVKEIAANLKEGHQTILFSATMGKEVRKLTHDLLHKPITVEVAREATIATGICHRVLFVTQVNKRKLLQDLMRREEMGQVLIFTRTKHGADRLAKALGEKGHKADSIHGDKPQRTRERVLKAYRNGKTNVLVATDVAARGIDVPGISHVVNFDMPQDPENYVHRIGRTGRAEATGTAISLCNAEERPLLRAVEKVIQQRVAVDTAHDWHEEIAEQDEPREKPARRGRGRPGQRDRSGSNSGRFGAARRASGRRKNSPWQPETDREEGGAPARMKRRKPAKPHRKGQTARNQDVETASRAEKPIAAKPKRKKPATAKAQENKPFAAKPKRAKSKNAKPQNARSKNAKPQGNKPKRSPAKGPKPMGGRNGHGPAMRRVG